jgi:hypothetical protein
MKARIFVVTLVAASLMSFGAFANNYQTKSHTGPSVSISNSFNSIKVAVVKQIAVNGGTNVAVVVQSPITVNLGGR